jgi:hypothetical protein
MEQSNDAEMLKKELQTFRSSMDEWVLFLDRNQREMKARILEMEHRIRDLEKRKMMNI